MNLSPTCVAISFTFWIYRYSRPRQKPLFTLRTVKNLQLLRSIFFIVTANAVFLNAMWSQYLKYIKKLRGNLLFDGTRKVKSKIFFFSSQNVVVTPENLSLPCQLTLRPQSPYRGHLSSYNQSSEKFRGHGGLMASRNRVQKTSAAVIN